MKTTLIIPDALYRRIKQRAVASRRTVSDLVAELLQSGLREETSPRRSPTLPPLPAFDLGTARIDVADRDALERAMGPAGGQTSGG